jgi:hypothetical protein
MLKKTSKSKKNVLRRAYIGLILISVSMFIIQCTPTIQSAFATIATIDARAIESENPNKSNSDWCENTLNYTPDTAHLDHFPMKYVRINIHFMNSSDSTHNFNGEEGIKYAESLIYYANLPLQENQQMFLPKGNNTPVLPVQYTYVLTSATNSPEDKGVYFHYDDDLYYFIQVGKDRNLASRTVLDKYNVGEDTILNLFVMPHHPDSIASPTYSLTETGIALGNSVKIAGLFEGDKPIWHFKGLINHEIGHVLGLSHTWRYNDGCDDTPANPNCWNITTTAPCNDNASNNVMDYNSRQNAWTPCQIGRIHQTFANTLSRSRKVLIPNWCQLHEDKHIFITDSIHWKGAKDLEGNLTIKSGGYLKISCRVSIPENGKITVEPGGTLILDQSFIHNDCGKKWQGIEIQTQGKKVGKVVSVGKIRLEQMMNKFE